MGFHEDLDEAMWMALSGMLDLMTELYSISRTEAYAYATLTVDLRVTQIVNILKGVHAFCLWRVEVKECIKCWLSD